MTASNLYLGAMSGTSLDGLDLALCDFNSNPIIIHSGFYLFTPELRTALFELCHSDTVNIRELYQSEQIYSTFCANAINDFLETHNIPTSSISALGFHGQTIRHEPNLETPFTVQLADLSRIAATTSLTTIGDFRRKDLALNGQGAPLVPPFHNAVFGNTTHRIIANIGGIANITVLDPNTAPLGYDTGPGNALLDYWYSTFHDNEYDDQGNWARTGTVDASLLEHFLNTPYLNDPAPKSTGRELFNADWLNDKLETSRLQAPLSQANTHTASIPAKNIQATLVEFTARTLTDQIMQHPNAKEVYLCGGGWRNCFLVERISAMLGENYHLCSTSELGIDPDCLEATAFAWLAKNTLNNQDSNQASATGAIRNAVLGGIFLP